VSNEPQTSIWIPDTTELRARAKWRAGFWGFVVLFFLVAGVVIWLRDGRFPEYLSGILIAAVSLYFAVLDLKKTNG
jgi:hypothetical protein